MCSTKLEWIVSVEAYPCPDAYSICLSSCYRLYCLFHLSIWDGEIEGCLGNQNTPWKYRHHMMYCLSLCHSIINSLCMQDYVCIIFPASKIKQHVNKYVCTSVLWFCRRCYGNEQCIRIEWKQSRLLILCPCIFPSLVPESKMIEKHGGYKFTVPVVPSTFNFGGSAPGMNWVVPFSPFFLPCDWL